MHREPPQDAHGRDPLPFAMAEKIDNSIKVVAASLG